MKSLYFLVILLLLNIITIKCQILYWYDTTNQRNEDFNKDTLPSWVYTYATVPNQYIKFDDNGYPYMEYSMGDNPTYEGSGALLLIKNESTFNAWTRVIDPEITLSGTFNFTTQDTDYYYNSSFFPVDGLGFGNGVDAHNYKYCVAMEFNSQMNVTGSEDAPQLNMAFYDDLYIFSNGELAYSYTAINQINNLFFNFPNTYEPYKLYQTIIINCNRKKRTNNSIKINSTNFELHCDFVDECGVCQGDGSICNCDINPYLCTDDEYLCAKRECVDSYQCVTSSFNCSEAYPHDACVTKECQMYGGCITDVVQCDDGDQCTNSYCDPIIGCVYEPIPHCVPCDPEKCITTDLCNPLECIPLLERLGDCIPKPVNCSSPNQCIIGSCLPENGQCSFIERNCNDHDHCTLDYCDPDIGCVYVPIPNCIPCGEGSCVTEDLCIPIECSPTIPFVCNERPINCSHPDPCIIGVCEYGECKFHLIDDCGSSESSSESPITTTVTTSDSTTTTTSTTGITSSTTLSTTTTGVTSSTTSLTTTSSTTGITSSTTSSTTTSQTSSTFDACAHFRCPLGKHCFNVNGEAICKKTTCLSCDDLNCHERNLKCISIKQNIPNPCHKHDCCEYIVSCAPN